MVWQDIVIAVANGVFSYALIYQVFLGFKKKKGFLSFQTAFLTTIALLAVAISYFALGLLISGIVASVSTSLWFLLLLQRIIYKMV